MNGCVAKRWGNTQFTKTAPTNPEAHQEMEKRLAEMQQARKQQDGIWSGEEVPKKEAPKNMVVLPAYDVKKTRGF